ncbi:MAG TPA: patatin-like phospholipase family protein [Gemmata sp.]|nr:patatin-like phospholipase family protein [Gemmata sp.]
MGLSFSGGGIRSATFNLGILQALGRLNLLTRIDFLSTVSGGGYIGGWLAAWIRRAQGDEKAAIEAVQKRLDPRENRREAAKIALDSKSEKEPEPETVRHLRAHSRYLAPRFGLIPLDSWTLVSIYFRNLFINSLIVFPVVMLLAIFCRLMVVIYGLPVVSHYSWFNASTALLFAFVALLLGALVELRRRLTLLDRGMGNEGTHRGLTLLLFLAAILGPWLVGPTLNSAGIYRSRLPKWIRHLDAYFGGDIQADLIVVVILFSIFGIVSALITRYFRKEPHGRNWLSFLAWLHTVLFGLFFGLVLNHFLFAVEGNSILFAAFGPPLFIITLLAAGYVEIALAGGQYSEYELELRSRINANLLRGSIGWIVLFGAVVYIPWGVRALEDYIADGGANNLGAAVPWSALLGWLLTTAGGAVVARRASQQGSNRLLTLIAKIVPPLFLIGLVAIGSEVSFWLYKISPDNPAECYRCWLQGAEWQWVLFWFLMFAFFGYLAFCLIPATQFSLHSLYMNRLVRCYLGASRHHQDNLHGGEAALNKTEPRCPNIFTGFDPNDDLPLAALRVTHFPPKTSAKNEHEDSKKIPPYPPYLGPYPIFNATLNLVAGEDLAYQDRKGSSFILTPDYCGSRETGYALLNEGNPIALNNLTLGRAITISGAAVDPNMNVLQSPPLTAFLTILNARLGWWIRNPKTMTEDWDAGWPQKGAHYYFKELFGMTGSKDEYVHLTDGGHFENTGAYELIRRRCRYVIVVDAAEDTSDASENLANLIRLVRTDFGIAIDIDTSPLRQNDNGLSLWHCAIGAIRYDEVDPSGVTGTLVFIRSSLTGDEDPDLRNYAATHPPFPHQSTADQFFDEAQFESYRALGYHIGVNVFAGAKEVVEEPDLSKVNSEKWDEEYRGYIRAFFAAVRREWAPLPDGATDAYLTSCREYLAAVGTLRDRGDLRGVSRSLFQEAERLVRSGVDFNAQLRELHEIDYLLQVMEISWLENDLDRFFAHPLNRGWMNVLRRWTSSDVFHQFWPVLRSQYSRGFVRFCERALNLDQLPVRWCQIDDPDDEDYQNILKSFDTEFHREWAHILSLRGNIAAAKYITSAVKNSSIEIKNGKEETLKPHLAWIITTGRAGDKQGIIEDGWKKEYLPLGVIVAFKPLTPSATKPLPQTPVEPKVNEWELLVWLRGGYRSLGLGGDCFPDLLRNKIIPSLEMAQVCSLFVRYPQLGTTLGERLQQTIWRWFFNDNDFVTQLKGEGSTERSEIRLVRNFFKPHGTEPSSVSGEPPSAPMPPPAH